MSDAVPPPEPLPPASWRNLATAILAGGTLTSFPWSGPAWFLRLWVLGWMLELCSRVATHGRSVRYPSWRHPWRYFRRGLSFFLEAFPLLLPGSFLLHSGWILAWVNSFEKVHDYKAFAFLTVVTGFLLLAPCFVFLPLATVHAAVHPRTQACWRVEEVRALARALPLSYGPLLLLTYFTWLPMQLLRQPILQNAGGFLVVGWLGFSVALAQKLLWARHYAAASRALAEGRTAGPWTRRLSNVPIWTLAVLYGFGLMVVQFVMWNSGWEWFSHFLFLLPGVPAPLGGPSVHW